MTGSSSGGRILVTGSSNTDLVCLTDRLPRPGETVASSSFSIYPGGKAANQAVAASRSGSDVAFVGCFGGDDYGRDRRQEMESERIDLTFARAIGDVTSGLALIAVDPAGENLIVTVGGANDYTTGDQLREALGASPFDVVLLPNEAPFEVISIAILGSGSAMVVLNAAPFAEALRRIVDEVDVLVCNEVEASQFLEREVGVASAEADVRALASLAGGRAVITLGASGAVGWDEAGFHEAPALPVTVVDTTGAGDAFCGAFASWLAGGADFDESLRAGVAAGSLATTRAGAQPSLPRYDEIAQRL